MSEITREEFGNMSPVNKGSFLVSKYDSLTVDEPTAKDWKSFELITLIWPDVTGKWIALDNRDGKCWVEEFESKQLCEDWLFGAIPDKRTKPTAKVHLAHQHVARLVIRWCDQTIKEYNQFGLTNDNVIVELNMLKKKLQNEYFDGKQLNY